MTGVTAEEIARFWIEDVGPGGWYKRSDEIDTRIRERYLPCWESARAGGLEDWQDAPDTTLSYLILTDQFPRNMFREDERAYATDRLARDAARMAIYRRWDMTVPEPQRQFFYLPLMHSESLGDQDACIQLMVGRMPETGGENLIHARVHREIIRRFGRFPYRNALHRRMTLPSEQAFLEGEGYGGIMRELQAADETVDD
ncbi:DUF924 family protein [Tropicimonas sp. IMCC6043]|uniref:DUF924 family protein n=1 Tax=Tropicimonas sp. IMCC6043 TaxID=2510645 RepID=UPI00101D5C44|nr:DUF924 family protein [Tropicimonas sp. IMCC6043]RYH12375.1 DUF924 domain-containing protein [Tropicimonas sp. IMCC6043]